MSSVLRSPIFEYEFLNSFKSNYFKGTIRPEYNSMKWFGTIGLALVRTQLLFLYYFFGGLEYIGHSFAYVAHFILWETSGFDPESCRSKQARYQLSHPSPTNLPTHFPNLATRLTNLATNLPNFATNLPNLATNLPNLATYLTNLATQKTDRTQLLYWMFINSLFRCNFKLSYIDLSRLSLHPKNNNINFFLTF